MNKLIHSDRLTISFKTKNVNYSPMSLIVAVMFQYIEDNLEAAHISTLKF